MKRMEIRTVRMTAETCWRCVCALCGAEWLLSFEQAQAVENRPTCPHWDTSHVIESEIASTRREGI